MSEKEQKRREEQEPREIELPPVGYQPTKAELEEEMDMPGLSFDQIRNVLSKPVRIVRE